MRPGSEATDPTGNNGRGAFGARSRGDLRPIDELQAKGDEAKDNEIDRFAAYNPAGGDC